MQTMSVQGPFAGEHDVWPHDGRRSRQESNHGCCQLDVCDVKHQNGTRSTHHDGTSGAAAASASPAGRGRWHGEQSHEQSGAHFAAHGGAESAAASVIFSNRRCCEAAVDIGGAAGPGWTLSLRGGCVPRAIPRDCKHENVGKIYIARAWNCPLPLATISHFDQGQDQPAFSPDQLASGSLRGAAEDQVAATDQPGGGSNQPGTNQLRRTRGSGPTRANQAWRSGHQAPTSHGSATMVGRPPPAVQPVRISGWFVVRRLCPDQPSRVARKLSKRLESG